MRKCDNLMKKYMMFDIKQGMPMRIRFHTLFCKSCKNEIKEMNEILESMEGSLPYEMFMDMTGNIMNRIEELEFYYIKSVSNFKWLSAGIIIFASIFLVQFSNSFSWLKYQFGGNLEIPINIAFGVILSVYTLFFTGAHVDSFKKVISFVVKD